MCDRSRRVALIVPFDVVSQPMGRSLHSSVYFVLLAGDSSTLDAHFAHNAAEVHAVAPVDSDSFAVESCHSSCLVATDIAFSVDPVDSTCVGDLQPVPVPAFVSALVKHLHGHGCSRDTVMAVYYSMHSGRPYHP